MALTASRKIKEVYLPVLFWSLLFMAIYNGLVWMLVFGLEWLQPNYTWYGIWGALALLGVLGGFILDPYYQQLRIQGKRSLRDSFLSLATFLAVCTPTFFLQWYWHDSSGTMAHLSSIHQLDAHTPPRFLILDSVTVGQAQASTYSYSYRGRRTFNFYTFAVMPLLAAYPDTACHAWLGFNYVKSADRSLDGAAHDRALTAFARKNGESTASTDFTNFLYLRLVDGDEIGDYAVARTKAGECLESPIYLPKYESYEDRGGRLLSIAGISLLIGQILLLTTILLIPFSHQISTDWDPDTR